MRHILCHISKLGLVMGCLIAADAAHLVTTCGFRLVARDEIGSDIEASPIVDV